MVWRRSTACVASQSLDVMGNFLGPIDIGNPVLMAGSLLVALVHVKILHLEANPFALR